MKKIISLYLLMLLICPIGAQAASVPSVIGALSWTMNFLPIFSMSYNMQCTTTGMFAIQICVPNPIPVMDMVTAINASVTDPQNGLQHYSLTGTASLQGAISPIPISGVMSPSGAGYILQFNFPSENVTCTIAQSSLSGACFSNLNPAGISKFTLVTP